MCSNAPQSVNSSDRYTLLTLIQTLPRRQLLRHLSPVEFRALAKCSTGFEKYLRSVPKVCEVASTKSFYFVKWNNNQDYCDVVSRKYLSPKRLATMDEDILFLLENMTTRKLITGKFIYIPGLRSTLLESSTGRTDDLFRQIEAYGVEELHYDFRNAIAAEFSYIKLVDRIQDMQKVKLVCLPPDFPVEILSQLKANRLHLDFLAESMLIGTPEEERHCHHIIDLLTGYLQTWINKYRSIVYIMITACEAFSTDCIREKLKNICEQNKLKYIGDIFQSFDMLIAKRDDGRGLLIVFRDGGVFITECDYMARREIPPERFLWFVRAHDELRLVAHDVRVYERFADQKLLTDEGKRILARYQRDEKLLSEEVANWKEQFMALPPLEWYAERLTAPLSVNRHWMWYNEDPDEAGKIHNKFVCYGL